MLKIFELCDSVTTNRQVICHFGILDVSRHFGIIVNIKRADVFEGRRATKL